MSSNLTNFFGSEGIEPIHNSSLGIASEERRTNKRTKAETHRVTFTDGTTMRRTITATGAIHDEIHRPPVINSKEDLDNAIIDYRRLGMTQQQIADELGCSQSYVSKVLNGR